MRTLKIFTFVFLLAIAIVAIGHAQQKPGSHPATKRFELGEELHFEAEFSRLMLRKLDVADLKFRASRTPVESDSQDAKPYALSFSADISSKGFFARLFNLKFRERVESTVEPITFTVQKTKIIDEQGKRVRNTESTFDPSKGKMTWTSRDPNNPGAEPRHARVLRKAAGHFGGRSSHRPCELP